MAGKRSTWASPQARGSKKMAQTLTASRSGTMSFAAMREQERVAEAANIGPGSFDGYAQSHAFG